VVEKQIELLPQTLETISENITKIGGIMRESTENIHRADEQGKGFAARLANINRVADLMNEPTEEIWTSCNLYASQIDTVDQAFRIIIEQSAHEITERQAQGRRTESRPREDAQTRGHRSASPQPVCGAQRSPLTNPPQTQSPPPSFAASQLRQQQTVAAPH